MMGGSPTGGGAAPLSGGPPLGMSDLSSFATLPAGVGMLDGGLGGAGVTLPGDLGGAGGMAPIGGVAAVAGVPGAPVATLGGAGAFGTGSAAPGPSSALSMMAEQLLASNRKLEAMEGAEARAQRVVEQRSAADEQRRRLEQQAALRHAYHVYTPPVSAVHPATTHSAPPWALTAHGVGCAA